MKTVYPVPSPDLTERVDALQEDVQGLAQNEVKRTLLWSTPSGKAETISANTVITLSSSDYDLLEVWVSPYLDDAPGSRVLYYAKGAHITTYAVDAHSTVSSSWLMARLLRRNSDTQFTVLGGVCVNWGASGKVDVVDTLCNPTHIYGIKY